MSFFLVLRERDNRNRWRNGQVCPDVGQGIMAPWARRPGCVLVCYAQIGRGRPRDFCDLPKRRDEGRVVNVCLKGFFSGDEEKKRRLGVLEGAVLKPLAAIRVFLGRGVVKLLPRRD
ncbi:hypothetical protein TNCV_1058691 [Trichonephila clavipes]|nr:hypothetical protein TNCV_1058691 [Trichonephila clavipes]